MTTTAKCKFQPGMLVQVEQINFDLPGMPRGWAIGTVESIEIEGRLFDVRVRMADGRLHAERVGPRGGGRRIRAAA